MKNWFLSKSIAVRIAVIALSAAVVSGAGVGIYAAVSHSSSDKKANVSETTDQVAESPVILDEETKNADTDTADTEPEENAVSETDITENIKSEDVEMLDTFYTKTSDRLENGDFSSGLDAWEAYSFVEDNIDYYVADGVFTLTMGETGTEDWHVQLKQAGIRLEKGKWYTIRFDAKSTLGRSILCSLQRDGMLHNDDWTPYANAKEYTVGAGWKTYTYTFQMNENTDNAAVLMFSLGAVSGRKITSEHTVSIDNVSITRLADNWTDTLRTGDNLIANPTFAYESTLWDASVVAPGAARVSFAGNKADFNITNVGNVDWHVQLRQGAIRLQNNTGYRLTFTVSSSVARTIKIGFMDTEYVNWYGGGDVVLNGTANQKVTVDFYNSLGDNANAQMMISMGMIDGVATPAGNISFSDFCLVKCDTVTASSAGNGGGSNPNHSLSGGWILYDHECAHTNSVYESNGVFNVSIINTGSENWHVQLKNSNIKLEKNKYYRMSYEVKSSVERQISVVIMRDGDWVTYSSDNGDKNVGTEWTSYSSKFMMTEDTDEHAIFNFALGKVNGQSVSGQHLVSIRNIVIEEIDAPVNQNPNQVLKDDGAISSEVYFANAGNTAAGNKITITDGKIVAQINDVGDAGHSVQVTQSPVKIENGAKYKVTMTVASTVARNIKADFLTPGDYQWIGGATIPIAEGGAAEYAFTFTSNFATVDNAIFAISMGDIDGAQAGTVTFTAISVEKVVVSNENIVEPVGNRGEYVLDPAKYGIGSPMGKDIEITVKMSSSKTFKGTIGGKPADGSDWKQDSNYFEVTGGGTTTFVSTFEAYNGYMKIDFWYMEADVELVEITMKDVTANNDPGTTGVIVTKNDSNKGEYVLDPTAYGISDPAGKDIEITVKMSSSGTFNGTIGGKPADGSDWKQDSNYFEVTGGGSTTFVSLFEDYNWYAKIDFWYIESEVKIEEISMRVVESNAGNNGPVKNEIQLAPKANPADGYEGGEFIDTSEYIGKNVKITVTFESETYYGGAISAMSGDEWFNGVQQSSDNGHNTWEQIINNLQGSVKFDIWWSGSPTLKYYDVVIEVIE